MANQFEFKNHKIFEYDLAGRKLIIETGKMAQLANGTALVRYGDTAILATATASEKPRDGIDYMPLAVDYEERLYAVGKIPGSFMKREGRPTEKAVLTSRVIDRPIRPLFPKDLRNDIVLSLLVLSVDQDNSPEIAAMIGASIALSISDIPWDGPIGGVFVGLCNGEIIINPTAAQRENSDLELTVAASREKVVMIEAGANEVKDDIMYDAIIKAHDEIKPLIDFINNIKSEIGKEKFEYESAEVDHDLYDKIKAFAQNDIKFALDTDDKTVREERLSEVYSKVFEYLKTEYIEVSENYIKDNEPMIKECMYKLQKETVRRWLLDEQKRVDGRRMDEIRPLSAEVGILPRVHGSGMFTRGQTQVLTTATLASISNQQKLDGIDEEEAKRYMHHYNFPAYSVGEAKASRGAGRREIGHGALAERSLIPVLPSVEEFPYAIRTVSEVISSNGSTSQGSVCGSTLALMDAGVPIKRPVAGISCGLITEGDRWMTMIDIQGLEDFFGDMDFKVAGTHDGITSIQMDLKIDGLTPEIIKKAFEVTNAGRIMILDEIMLKCIAEPRPDVSEYAPKMITMKVAVDKISEVIGPKGKVIQKIIADCGGPNVISIDIQDDGSIFIAAIDKEAGYKAHEMIKLIAFDPEPGQIFKGRVTGILAGVGCFVEYLPGREGMVHISRLANRRVEKVEEVAKMGDEFEVMYMGINPKGKVDLSKKDADNKRNQK
ncbi:MAG: polyribonucleotide nucleotidyltransferase [Oscillospiraceae bacterium]|nr:polyribonucleotide nucleotidyltransferase [Oscillospiraceae bacterium]